MSMGQSLLVTSILGTVEIQTVTRALYHCGTGSAWPDGMLTSTYLIIPSVTITILPQMEIATEATTSFRRDYTPTQSGTSHCLHGQKSLFNVTRSNQFDHSVTYPFNLRKTEIGGSLSKMYIFLVCRAIHWKFEHVFPSQI